MNKSLPVRTGRVVAGSTLLVGGAGLGVLLAPSAGAATTYHVTNLDDSGAGSLRQALLDANGNAGADIVVFDAGVTGTITLTSGQLEISDSVTITGPGSASLSISNATDKVFYLYATVGGRTIDATITGLTLTGGASALYSWTTNLVLDDIVATGSTSGSLVASFSNHPELEQSLTIRNSKITDANNSNNGAGIFVGFGDHPVTIDKTTISGNTTTGGTGGVRVESASTVDITDSVISDNSAGYAGGGGFFATSVGSVTIVGTTVDGNTSSSWGGGLYFNNETVSVLDSTVSNNTAAAGGGGLQFDNDQTVATVANTTITGNMANNGGGVMMEAMASLTIDQSTITANSASTNGGGISTYSDESLTLSGTIVSGNVDGVTLSALPSSVAPTASSRSGRAAASLTTPARKNDGRPTGNQPTSASTTADIWVKDSAAMTIDVDHSLLGDGTIDPNITVNGTGNVTSNTPGLGALADNGGTTKTMALLTGSPAIDAGPDPVATFDGNTFDQRRSPYVRVYDGRVDIGAFELQPDPTPTTTTTTAPVEPVVPTFTG